MKNKGVGLLACSFVLFFAPQIAAADNKLDEIPYEAVLALSELNYPKALRLARKPSEQGNALAEFIAGYSIMASRFELGSVDESEALLRRSSEKGSVEGSFGLGEFLLKNPRYQKQEFEAFLRLKYAAERDHHLAAFKVGMLHYERNQVPQPQRLFYHRKEAAKWTRRSASRGLAEAQFNMGEFHRLGHGVEKDIREAVRYYELAAAQDLALAQYMAGAAYFEGVGMSKNVRLGTGYICAAASNNHLEAKKQLREMRIRCGDANSIADSRKQTNSRSSASGGFASLLGDVLVAALVTYAAVKVVEEIDRKDSKDNYDFAGTENINSSQLGAELLTQKREKRISGRGQAPITLPQYQVSDFQTAPVPRVSLRPENDLSRPSPWLTPSNSDRQVIGASGKTCRCMCVDGASTSVCGSNTALPVQCNAVCPKPVKTYQLRNTDVPPPGTSRCEFRQVILPGEKRYQTVSLCQ